MDEFFRVDPDVGRRRLTLTLRGFWTMEVMNAYADSVRRALDKMDREAPGYVLLCDARGMPIQSREVAEAQAVLIAESSTRNAPTAVVVDQVLAQMQVKRMGGDTTGYRAFLDMDEAGKWLDRVSQDRK